MNASRRRRKGKNKGKGYCLWSNIELLFDVAKTGVCDRKLNKLDLRILAARREHAALKKRGIEGVELHGIINRDGASRKIGPAEIQRQESELRLAFRAAKKDRRETHTMEVPRWIMEALSAGKFTVSRGLALLFYLYRRLVKQKNHAKNWLRVGQAYGRFKLSDLKEACGIHISRACEALQWLKKTGIIQRAWVPFFERMKRGACYTDGFRMIKNGNNFGQNRKSVYSRPETQKTYTGNLNRKSNFELVADASGRIVAQRA